MENNRYRLGLIQETSDMDCDATYRANAKYHAGIFVVGWRLRSSFELRRGTPMVCGSRRWRLLLWAWLWALTLTAPGRAGAQPAGQLPSVLLLLPQRSTAPALVLTEATFRRTLESRYGGPVDVFVENLDLALSGETAYIGQVKALLAAKYANHRFDVVVTHRLEALAFAVANRQSLFFNAPLVFYDLSESALKSLGPQPDITGVFSALDATQAVEQSLALLPDTRHVAVVGGASTFDRQGSDLARQILRKHAGRIEILSLDARPLDEQLARLAALPEHSLVIVSSYRADTLGRSLVASETVARLARAANAPTFGYAGVWMGLGIVGGHLIQYEVMAERAAASTARILKGESASSIPINREPSTGLVFDWRELRRWGIDEGRLPPNSTVLFRQPTLWSEYRTPLLGGLVFVATLTLLIGVLLVERRNRQRTQAGLAKAEERYRTVADFTADWEYWTDPDGGFIYTSPSCRAVTGYDAADFMSRPALSDELVLEDDRQTWADFRRRAMQAELPVSCQVRLRTKDGTLRWIDVVATRVTTAEGRDLGVRGSARDITAEKETAGRLQGTLRELQTALDENGRLRDQLEADNAYLREELERDINLDGILGASPAMQHVVSRVQQVAETPSTVMLLGETGVGKSQLARAIHSISPRRDKPFVTLNCAVLPASLIETELFGHEKGAFTGAQARRVGYFEAAHGGTLFLDEIGELPLELQGKFLRTVQDGHFERVGGNALLKTDVRLIVATNRHLEEDVRTGRFRQDLWYRLNVFPITVPPLRQRTEDIPLLVTHFVEKHSHKLGRPARDVSKATMKALLTHAWPGNVRELENVVERAVIVSRGARLEIRDDDPFAKDVIRAEPAPLPTATNHERTLRDAEKELIADTLERLGGRVAGPGGAADVLGINASTLRSRMRKLGLIRQRPAP